MNRRNRQSGKVGIIILVILLILAFVYRDQFLPGSSAPDILSVESFQCVFAMGNVTGVSGPSAGVAGRFDISVMNLSEERLTDIFVEVTARHPDSRSNRHSLITQLSPARLKPGKLGKFKGGIAAPQMAMANASVEKLMCLMKIGTLVDGELQPIAVKINGLDMVSATEAQATIVL